MPTQLETRRQPAATPTCDGVRNESGRRVYEHTDVGDGHAAALSRNK